MTYDLEERTAKFGENIIELCKKTSKNPVTLPIIDQLIRSGTSIGANYAEANNVARGDNKATNDFLNSLEKHRYQHGPYGTGDAFLSVPPKLKP